MKAMESAFGKAHLEGYVIEGSKIRVPRGQKAAYMGALADAKALPKNFGSYLHEGPRRGQPLRTQRGARGVTKSPFKRSSP